jgi:acyl carrier protein
MRDQISAFVIDSLRQMNYDTDGIDDATMLGAAGVDLESLALAELAVRMEDRYGVSFSEDDLERVAAMSVGELVDHLTAAAGTAAAGTAAAGTAAAGTAAAGTPAARTPAAPVAVAAATTAE